MFMLHSDPNFHFEAIRALGLTRYYGGDVLEQLEALDGIPAGDFEAWYKAWSGLARRVVDTVDESKLETYTPATIRDVYFRASHYQFVADFFLHGNSDDPRLYEDYKLWTKWFDTANANLAIPGKRVNIETQHGFYVPAIFYRAEVASNSNPRPTILIHGGFDSYLEENLHFFGFAALGRGYNVVIFEGPGQLGVVHEQKKGWIADWEKVVSPVVDYVISQKDKDLAYMDTSKLVLLGMSLGGYLAARAAAFEPRLAATVLIGGVWSFEDCIIGALAESKDAWTNQDEKAFNAVWDGIDEKSSTGHRWFHDQGTFSAQVKTGWEAMQIFKQMAIEDVVHQIKMPTFVGWAKHDIFFGGNPTQPEKVAKAIGSNATLFQFGDELAAGLHCACGALTYQNQEIYEWVSKVIGR